MHSMQTQSATSKTARPGLNSNYSDFLLSNATSHLSDAERRHEADRNTYAPLFSPPTPRASPAPTSPPTKHTSIPFEADYKMTSRLPHPRVRPLSFQHYRGENFDMGAGVSLVSVPAKEDPLSLLAFELEASPPFGSAAASAVVDGNGDGIEHAAVTSIRARTNTDNNTNNNAAVSGAIVPPSHPLSLSATNNATRDFFGKFVQDAKAASESKRRSVLDELLLHQDDPLFRTSVAPLSPTTTIATTTTGTATLSNSDREIPSLDDGGGASSLDQDGPAIKADCDSHQDCVHDPKHSGDQNSDTVKEAPKVEYPDVTQESIIPTRDDHVAHHHRQRSATVVPISSTGATALQIADALSEELDHSVTGSPPLSQSRTSPTNRSFSSRRPSTGSSFSSSHSLTPPTLAPPVESPSIASYMPDQQHETHTLSQSLPHPLYQDQDVPESTTPTGTLPRRIGSSNIPKSVSYSTFGSLPSRWMSSLLATRTPSQPSHQGAAPSLESIFAASTAATNASVGIDSGSASITSSNNSTTAVAHSEQASHKQRSKTLGHAASVPSSFKDTSISQMYTQSHYTPTKLTTTATTTFTHDSPFASHIFTPISGAPGFAGDMYDWDKGYSNELQKELQEHVQVVAERRDGGGVQGDGDMTGINRSSDGRGLVSSGSRRKDSVVKRIRDKLEKSGVAVAGRTESGVDGRKNGKGKENRDEQRQQQQDPKGGSINVGEFIEKKSGSVELKGRRELTTPVLDVGLADMLRAQLPALDRLPKTWSLVYSLDQHGISLNTLYTRCEAHTQAREQVLARAGLAGARAGAATTGRKGVLLVMKDSGDAVFGVWVGGGVRQSKGKGYYGSGESFLWKYSKGTLKVFRWSGKNEYVALCESDFISFGGGDGKYGLYLDDTLFDGSSASCPTFDNEPLCSPGPNKAGTISFECVGLEVWGIGP